MNHQFQKGTFFMSHFHDFSNFFSKKFFGQKIPHEKLGVVWGVKTHKTHFIRYKVYVESQGANSPPSHSPHGLKKVHKKNRQLCYNFEKSGKGKMTSQI